MENIGEIINCKDCTTKLAKMPAEMGVTTGTFAKAHTDYCEMGINKISILSDGITKLCETW